MELVYPQSQYGFAHLAARFAGVEYKSTVLSDMGQVKKIINDEGSVPVLKTQEGNITTSSAIARYFARVASDKNLLGSDEFEQTQIDELMNIADLEIQPACKTIMYILGGRVPCESPSKLKLIVNELKKSLDWYNRELSDKEFLVGKSITLADIQLASYIAYPLSFVINPPFRNKILNLMNWFYRVTSLDGHFEKVFGKIKLSTKMLDVPKLPKKKEEIKQVKKEEKKSEKPKKKVEKKAALPDTKIVLDDFKRFIINSKNKDEDLTKFLKEEYEPENWSIWHLKYDIYKNEGAKMHVTSNLCSGFLERAEACRRVAFGIHCVLGEEPNLEIEGVWMWRGQEVIPEMKDHPTFEYYAAKKLDLSKSDEVQLIHDFWCKNVGDKMNSKTCQRKSHM